ncbi:phosphopantetheine-binding protein [Actinocorallia sp. API 0066]|nr:phosphopantetheine-binding protein [Actinocorallia sp. API 0066]
MDAPAWSRGSAAETGFWSAVADGDTDRLAADLLLPEELRGPLAELLPALARWRQDNAPAAPATDLPVPEEDDDAVAELRLRLAGASEPDQEKILAELVRFHAATVLGHADAAEADLDAGFAEAGFSSLTALDLRNRLCAATGLPLPPVAVFDHPTPAALARFMRAELAALGVLKVALRWLAHTTEVVPLSVLGGPSSKANGPG